MRIRLVTLCLIVSCIALAVAIPAHAQDKPTDRINAVADIPPVAYFVERVGGPHVEVSVLVKPGQEPHTFELTPRLAVKLAEARVLFTLGFPFEERISQKAASTYKNLKLVDLQHGIKLRSVTDEEIEAEGDEHHEGVREREHEHSHEAGELDRHTWLDPQLAKIQAKTIADTLIRLDPEHKAQYERNLKDFQNDLDAINKRLSKALAPVKGKSFFVFHPAYGYLGAAYGLKQVAVEEGGKEPTARQLARLIDLARKNGVRVIFVQPQFAQTSADAIARAIGGVVVPLDPLARDYLKNLREMAAKLESGLSGQKK